MSRVDATIGSALDLFGGSLLYTDVVAWHLQQQQQQPQPPKPLHEQDGEQQEQIDGA